MFNPNPILQRVALADGQQAYVVDEVLADPAALVQLALSRRAGFREAGHNAFPGLELRMPEQFTTCLDVFFAQHLRRLLGFRRTLRAYSRLSLVTRTPAQLAPAQWICHRDRMQAVAGEGVAACVLYLFQDSALGGTGFYAPRRPAPEIDRLVHDSGALPPARFQERYGIQAGYLTESNDWFEKVAVVPARFNRLVFYDGMHFHTSDILAPARLDTDPARGRLTLNGFFTCRRNAA